MNNIAVVTGCCAYRDDNYPDLPGVKNDIDLIGRAFQDYCGCTPNAIKTLVNNADGNHFPGRSDILWAIQGLSKEALPEPDRYDFLFFYFSGHGFRKNDDLYLIPSDAIYGMDDGNIKLSFLQSLLLSTKIAKKTIIILDTCQRGVLSKAPALEQELINRIDSIEGTVVFFSCSPDQQSYMLPPNEGEGSIYTKHLAEILNTPDRFFSVSEIACELKKQLTKYFTEHDYSDTGFVQYPLTRLEDESFGSLIIKTQLQDRHSDTLRVLDLSKSIWLKDAEKADREQTRFQTFTRTQLVNQFLDEENGPWGIASVKGIGKTFLLQVKRAKLSKKAICFPNVGTPSRDNYWGIEIIRFTNYFAPFSNNESYYDLKALWKYTAICYILNCWLKYYERQKKYRTKPNAELEAAYTEIVEEIDKQRRSGDDAYFSFYTSNYLTSRKYAKLQIIMENVLSIKNWREFVNTQYLRLLELGQILVDAVAQTNKRKIILFIDRLDQAMHQPNSEEAIDCADCSKKNRILECKNINRDSPYCFGEGEAVCKDRDLCCYGCEKFVNEQAGTNLRISDTQAKRNAHDNYWQLFQLALVDAAYDIKTNFSNVIQVMFTIRLEAYNYHEAIWGENRSKLSGMTCILDYTRQEQQKIYHECIEHQERSLLYSPLVNNRPKELEYSFVGVNSICHPYVTGQKESIFDIIYRHSFDRTRDIQDYGNALTSCIEELRQCSTDEERGTKVKEIIEKTASRLAYEVDPSKRVAENVYYFEKARNMPSYWADPGNFEALLKEIDRNLLFEDDIRSICAKMNKVTTCPESGCQNCNHHPFSALYKLGMLGYVVPSENRNDYATQEFLSSDRITYFHEEDNLQINGQTLYLIHPALTKSIEKLKSGKKIKHFTGFIIGKGIEVKQSTLQQILKSHKESTKEDFVHFWYKNI